MKNLTIWCAVLAFIFLSVVAFVWRRPEGFVDIAGFVDTNSSAPPVPGVNSPYITSPAATPVPPSASGVLPAAAGIPNSVIPNAPAPPTAGIAQTLTPVSGQQAGCAERVGPCLTPVNLEANYEELRNMLTILNKNLPQDIKQQIGNLTPAIVNGMMEARNPGYAAKV